MACLGTAVAVAWVSPVARSSPRGAAVVARAVHVPAAAARGHLSSEPRGGHGTPASCTSAAVVAAVRAGGMIRFSCGPEPVMITMSKTAKVFNTAGRSCSTGAASDAQRRGSRRILYMDTCDRAQVWTTSHCQDQATPRLVVQNMRFADGTRSARTSTAAAGRDLRSRREAADRQLRVHRQPLRARGPDIGGGAVRALSQYHGLPVYVVGSRFGATSAATAAR